MEDLSEHKKKRILEELKRKYNYLDDEIKTMCPTDERLVEFWESAKAGHVEEVEDWDAESEIDATPEQKAQIEAMAQAKKDRKLDEAKAKVAFEKAQYEASQEGLTPEARTTYDEYLKSLSGLTAIGDELDKL